jgi:pyridoxal 5'-phosphate synthase pdxT subunit
MKIGVLALQGAISEHLDMLKACGVEGVRVRHQKDFSGLRGLVIPGGESTTIGRLIDQLAIRESIEEMMAQKKPLLGTCAGLVLLGREVEGCPEQKLLGCMDTVVVRNGFGRQRESFEKDMNLPYLGDDVPFPGVFIRAPYIAQAGEGVEILGMLGEKIISARQGNVLVAAFHPELTTDVRLHRYFLEMAP